MPDRPPPPDNDGSSFEAQWRERFEEFAELRDDDAGIAGWSPSGLETRFRFFTRRWSDPPAAGVWLDIGCGAGTYSSWLHRRGLHTIGLDYSQPTLLKARARIPREIALVAGDAMRLPFADRALDGALCFGVLQAVSDSATVVREIARVLAPGGTLWIDALNREGIAARLTELRRTFRGKQRHLRYESARALERCLVEAGFIDVRRHWLPIAPARLATTQRFLESNSAHYCVDSVPCFGRLLSHSVVFTARKALPRES
jgi:ubiquinone/menaquinone biosynthesis C-methylase UbiE